jgi:hypothetical protein
LLKVKFIDWMMALPAGLEQEFRQEVEQLEQERQMIYISSLERDAEQKGMQKGLQDGRQEEIEALLIAKFGEMDEALRTIVEPLMQCAAADRARMILQSREEPIAKRSRNGIAHFQLHETD